MADKLGHSCIMILTLDRLVSAATVYLNNLMHASTSDLFGLSQIKQTVHGLLLQSCM